MPSWMLIYRLGNQLPREMSCSILFELFGNLLPKRRKCIDHRLRERERDFDFIFSHLVLKIWSFGWLYPVICVWSYALLGLCYVIMLLAIYVMIIHLSCWCHVHLYSFLSCMRTTKMYVTWKSDPWSISTVHLHSNTNFK